MAFDVELADRLRLLLAGQHLTEKRMFGGLAFLVGGSMAVAVSGQGGIMVRVEPAEAEALAGEQGAAPFEMRGRPLKGWLRVEAAALDDDAALRTWAERGLRCARALPLKQRSPERSETP